jgi:putative ABC transport system permease protein
VPPRLSLYPQPLLASAAYGLLIAAVFALVPLARARTVPAATLFRGDLEPARGGRAGAVLLLVVLAAGAAIAASPSAPRASPASPPASSARRSACPAPHPARLADPLDRRAAAAPRNPVFRIALANLHRPGAQTGRLVVALGLGLTLFTTLAVIETNLAGQIRTTIPAKAPSFFMLDIPVGEIGAFRALAARAAPQGELVTIPSLRGSVVAIGEPAGRRHEGAAARGLVPARRPRPHLFGDPAGGQPDRRRQMVAADYSGPPLVSLDVAAARAVGLKVGDSLTVSVLGREIEARIASLREINWDTMGFNFVIVFAPGTLESAPHSFMATIAMPEAQERPFARAVSRAFPSVSAIRVKEVVETVGDMLSQLASRCAPRPRVAILAGIAVLVGALAASRRARIYDSVILKMLGATRGRILAAQARSSPRWRWSSASSPSASARRRAGTWW